MIFTGTALKGAYLLEIEKFEDQRGFFARTWCQKEFAARGLNTHMVQANLSSNNKKATLRGMHYQDSPHEEAKLVQCPKGAIYDVIIDLRPDSPTYKRWLSVKLTAANHKMLYVPQGFAHGYQTLENDTDVFYLVSQFYAPGAERGVRYDDPAFGIEWPLEPQVISDKDKNWPDYTR